MADREAVVGTGVEESNHTPPRPRTTTPDAITEYRHGGDHGDHDIVSAAAGLA